MNKMKRRARLCLLLAFILLAGVGYYVYELFEHGSEWVSYPGNGDLYTNGYISKGAIYDRDGTLLLENTDSGVPNYNEDYAIRTATVHATGDSVGNIATSANYNYADRLIGYSFFWGIFSTSDKGRNLYLTIDADLCRVANEALGGRKGCIGIYNYKTGEILCMVSSPNYDPLDPPEVSEDDTSGIYMNKFLSGTIVPGSTFKIVTAWAALENIDDIDSWSYTCPYSRQIGDAPEDKIVCVYEHGTVDLQGAMAYSCNNAFGELSMLMGPGVLKEYVEKAGLTKSYDIDGIYSTPSTFDFPKEDVLVAWTGIGQYHDLVNPCAMMAFLGAIANDGVCVEPRLVENVTLANGWDTSFSSRQHSEQIMDKSSADKLDELLHGDVTINYGEYNFPGLDICAKSGTAEVGEGREPNAWFVGYLRNPDHPYAFVVVIENGGSGLYVGGDVANTVLQEAIKLPAYEE